MCESTIGAITNIYKKNEEKTPSRVSGVKRHQLS